MIHRMVLDISCATTRIEGIEEPLELATEKERARIQHKTRKARHGRSRTGEMNLQRDS